MLSPVLYAGTNSATSGFSCTALFSACARAGGLFARVHVAVEVDVEVDVDELLLVVLFVVLLLAIFGLWEAAREREEEVCLLSLVVLVDEDTALVDAVVASLCSDSVTPTPTRPLSTDAVMAAAAGVSVIAPRLFV